MTGFLAPVAAGVLAEVHRRLRDRQHTLAVAESLTGGLLAATLTETPGASATFRGGLVVYATDLKARLAGVDEGLLRTRGAVDAGVAEELASGVRHRLGASWGVGVTGVAGPEPQDGMPVGTVFVAVIGPEPEPAPDGSVRLQRRVTQLSLQGDRNTIRSQSVVHTVDLLLSVLS